MFTCVEIQCPSREIGRLLSVSDRLSNMKLKLEKS